MALKDLLPSSSWSLSVGLGTGMLGAGGVAAGMVFNAGFASWVLGLTLAGVSLGGLGLPLAASVAIAAVVAGVGAFAAGSATYAVANTALNVVSSAFSWVAGLFSGNAKNPSNPDPKPGPNTNPNSHNVSSSLSDLGGTSPDQQLKNDDHPKPITAADSDPDNNYRDRVEIDSSTYSSDSTSPSMG